MSSCSVGTSGSIVTQTFYYWYVFVFHICWVFTLQCLGIFLCGLFGGNSSLILTTFPYNSKSAIQGGFQLLLKLGINYFYAYCIFVEYLRYKVLIYCLYELFGGNSLLIWTTLPYDSNYAIQGGCQLLLKMYITDFYAYCIFV